MPTNMELYVCNVDGTDLKQITNLGKANWAPYFHPKGDKVIFLPIMRLLVVISLIFI